MRLIATLILGAMISSICNSPSVAKPPTPDRIPTALQDYVAAKDDSFAWKLLKNDSSNDFLTYDINLTSQVWQGITWKHALIVFVPIKNLQHRDTVLQFIMGGSTGGKPSDDDRAMGRRLAESAQMPVAFLYQVPNQPLLGDR